MIRSIEITSITSSVSRKDRLFRLRRSNLHFFFKTSSKWDSTDKNNHNFRTLILCHPRKTRALKAISKDLFVISSESKAEAPLRAIFSKNLWESKASLALPIIIQTPIKASNLVTRWTLSLDIWKSKNDNSNNINYKTWTNIRCLR